MTDTPQPTDTPAAEAAAPEVKAPEALTESPAPAAEPAPEPVKAEQPKAEKKPDAKPAAKPKAEPNPEAKPEAKEPQNSDVLDAGDEPVAEPVDWPADWREKLAGDDKKLLSTLKRFTSPKTFSDSYFAMKQKLSSGEYLKALPENPSEEDLAEYRKFVGVPETPEAYSLELGDGLVIGDEDKPVVDDFLKNAHAANLTDSQVKTAVEWYYRTQEIAQEQRDQLDTQRKQERDDALRQEYGNDYRRNLNLVGGLLDTWGEDAKALILSARAPDGTTLLHNPAVVRALVQNATEINPVATVVSGSGANAANAINDEIARIESMMGDRSSEYWQGAKANGETTMQVRYRELVGARSKLAARAG